MDSRRVKIFHNAGLWPKLSNYLSSRYDILCMVNLFDYDHDMEQLWKELQIFKGHKFSESQRLIFTLYDTEYYLNGAPLGFTTENLIRILENLDISFGYCLLFTNHHGITTALSQRCGPFPITVVENNFSSLLTTPSPVILERQVSQIKKTFCFMSNQRRDHRMYIKLWVEDQNLTDRVVMSWHSNPQTDIRTSSWQSADQSTNACRFIYPHPFTRIHDKIPCSDFLENLYHRHQPVLDDDHRDESINFGPNQNNFEAPWLAKTFLNIVAETVFDYPYPYLTEKTFKCFWHRSPFIIVGAANSLKYLKSIGFRTFDQWIDESYDTIVDPTRRLENVCNSLSLISKWSIDQCRDVYHSMKPVLDHNLQHYQNFFCQTMLNQTIRIL